MGLFRLIAVNTFNHSLPSLPVAGTLIRCSGNRVIVSRKEFVFASMGMWQQQLL